MAIGDIPLFHHPRSPTICEKNSTMERAQQTVSDSQMRTLSTDVSAHSSLDAPGWGRGWGEPTRLMRSDAILLLYGRLIDSQILGRLFGQIPLQLVPKVRHADTIRSVYICPWLFYLGVTDVPIYRSVPIVSPLSRLIYTEMLNVSGFRS